MRKSLIQNRYICKVCGKPAECSHEVFYGTANRKKSIEDGMVIYLCHKHHNMSDDGIHFDKKMDLAEKKNAQAVWEYIFGNRMKFIQRYGKSYL